MSATQKWIRNANDERAVKNGCWFDESRVDHVVKFFSQFLKHSKGRFAGQPFELLDYQISDIIAPIFGWLRRNERGEVVRRITKSYVEIPKKNGKALALDTPLPTPTGWTTMGDVRVGDQLLDESGRPCRVVAATDVMLDRPCYRVEFSDGEVIVADAEHQWVTTTVDSRVPKIRTTKEIAGTLTIKRSVGFAYNHSIPLAGELKLPDLNFLIHPYILGAWLGDGIADGGLICYPGSDREILEHIRACGSTAVERSQRGGEDFFYARIDSWKDRVGCRRGHVNSSRKRFDRTICLECERLCDRARRLGEPVPAVTVFTLRERLKALGVYREKHIPMQYLRGSYAQRLSLLQGLMDTDGSATSSRRNNSVACEFSNTNERIALAVVELVRSLGLKPSLVVSGSVQTTKSGRKIHGNKYRVTFYAYSDTPVFRLRRKLGRLKPRPQNRTSSTNRRIKSVRPIDSVPMKCVQVDSPSHMYLAGLGMIPTHNSTIAAGLGLYLLVADGEEGAEVYSAATDVKQASIVHNEAVSMVGRSQELDRLLYINRTTKTIAYKDTSSAYKVLANNPKTNDGWNAHAIIADELHKWSGRELYDALRYAFAARDQPLFFQITTAGDSPLSICKEQHDYTLSVNSGAVIDERFHGVIYAADPSDNPLDEKVWKKANPSLGETISYESFRADAMEAAKSPVSMTAFKRYRLNIWTTGESPWLNQTDWAACRRDFCPEELEGSVCYAGLDLAKTQDTTSLQLVFRGEEEGEFQLLSYFWLPEETARNQSVVPWEQWAEQGHVFLTPGSVCDYSFVKQTIAQLAQDFKIQSLAYDSWGAAHLVQDLQDNVGLEVVEFGQGISHFAGPTAEFERLILGGKLHHVGQPVMDWQVGNAQIRVDSNGNKKPSKRSAKDHRKVDGVVAAIMALALAVDDQDVASVYDLPQEDRVLFL